jgi:hypothetical protein
MREYASALNDEDEVNRPNGEGREGGSESCLRTFGNRNPESPCGHLGLCDMV